MQTSTPKADGFWMPGEHSPLSSVWLAWPTRPDNWREQAVPGQATFAHFIERLSDYVTVKVAVVPEQEAQARAMLPEKVQIFAMPYNDSWMRDIGPTMVVNSAGEKRAVNWQFNAWGGELDGLYDDWSDDETIAKRVAEQEGAVCYDAPLILEGGSIHSDGEGTVYTTEECLLHPSRNPDLSRADIEAHLKDYLGIEKVIWLPQGLFNDETNGHIDNILHVVKPGEVILTVCEDNADPQYAISQKALDVLANETDARGRHIKVHQMPLPGPLYMSEDEAAGLEQPDRMAREAGERLGASYANFLICNGAVFYPLLDSTQDDRAKDVLEKAFPEHTIVGIPSREVLLGGGNLHCITQQIPA
ncbi:agmatine deiminase [Marinomonas piezotolerans]|uniref:Putative agmatine deiminase n=1 Tax=Marinomonas piezotolerans TaxID=2213058 RepID=A0A370UB53_9GAMM|nr:agmatine deiminase [Marinomonas piezotolerans]RDL44979.1 agmatine deiminase [Marinomonas piezotolerans]